MAKLNSPISNFPGHVNVPDFLTASHVDAWFRRSDEAPEALEETHVAFHEFFTRFDLFEFHIDGLEKIDPADMDSYPAQLAFWLVEETNELMNAALNKKN